MADLQAHSPLGMSSASRYMKCPGSVRLGWGIKDEESEYAAEGTNAHSLAERCLATGDDAWQYVNGSPATDFIAFDKETADAVQVYLNAVREAHPDRNQSNFFVERRFHNPQLHEYFYGTSDCTYVDTENKTLHVWDYKHGAGIVVEVENNPQLMGYGAGMMESLQLWGAVDNVVLHIAQPRAFHYEGPLREWRISVEELRLWLDWVLLPAMDRALTSNETQSGEHCRFCPVRSRACPQIAKDMDELETLMKSFEGGTADELSNAQVARFLDLLAVAKIAASAANKTAYNRLQAGADIPGYKLVSGRANRIWKADAEAALKAKFGDEAFTKPELKSPAEIEKMPMGKTEAAKYAYKPDVGLVVAKVDDTRKKVDSKVKSLFTDVTKGAKNDRS